MALALLKKSREYWRNKLQDDECYHHIIKQKLVSNLSTELEEGGSLYAALLFHVALHKLEWQSDKAGDKLKSSRTVKEYASAVKPEGCTEEMWERSIKNELWNLPQLNLTDFQNKDCAVLKGWPRSSAIEAHLYPLLCVLIPSKYHDRIANIMECRKGTETMKRLDERVEGYLKGQNDFPQLWKSFVKIQPREGSVTIHMKIIQDCNKEASETHYSFENIGTLQSQGTEFFLQALSEFMAGLSSTDQVDEGSPLDGITEDIDPELGSAPGEVDASNTNNTSVCEESDDIPEAGDLEMMETSLRTIESQVGQTKTLYEDYKDAIRYLGPSSSMPEMPKETDPNLRRLASLSREIIRCEEKIHRTWQLRSWARELIVGSLGSLKVYLDEEPESDLSKAARMITTCLADIALSNKEDGEERCSYMIILLSGKVLPTSR